MRCTLDGANTRILAKAIQSLSKFGNDLFIEADKKGMQLRSLNSTRSALGTFMFKRNFFETYSVKNNDENFCKISMKVALQVFRSMKMVEHCELKINSDTLKFQIFLKCRLETTRDHSLSIVDEENIAPAVSPDDTTNKICGSHKIFTEISANFNATEEEITLEAKETELVAKNYMEGAMVAEKFMRSQLKLKSNEFETYEVTNEATVTFCLREFRAFLMFAESINEDLSLHFEEAGSPVFVRIKRYDQVECLLIMSTLSPDDISFHEECKEREVTDIHERTTTRSAQKRKQKETPASKAKKRISEETTLSNDGTSLFQFPGENGISSSDLCSKSADVPRHCDMARQELNNDDHEDILIAAMSTIEDPENITFNATTRSQPDDLSVTFYDTEENQVQPKSGKMNKSNALESIPQSPNRDADGTIRKIFSRCFLSTYVPQEPSPNSQVFVPDSDTED